MQELLSQGADPNATLGENGDTPLHVYVRDGRYECLLSLLVHSNPDSLSIDFPAGDLNTPLHVAAQVRNSVCVCACLVKYAIHLVRPVITLCAYAQQG